jgi:hypothetical protein
VELRGAHPPRWSLAGVLIFKECPPLKGVTQGKKHLQNFFFILKKKKNKFL